MSSGKGIGFLQTHPLVSKHGNWKSSICTSFTRPEKTMFLFTSMLVYPKVDPYLGWRFHETNIVPSAGVAWRSDACVWPERRGNLGEWLVFWWVIAAMFPVLEENVIFLKKTTLTLDAFGNSTKSDVQCVDFRCREAQKKSSSIP